MIWPALGLIAGVGVLVVGLAKYRNHGESNHGSQAVCTIVPISENPNTLDRELVQQVLDEPEKLNSDPAPADRSHYGSQCKDFSQYADLSNRPALMSAQKEMRAATPEQRTVSSSTNSPVFVQTFVSMRNDEVRNPDSEQNQAAVKSIMKKRQNRVEQLNRSKIEI